LPNSFNNFNNNYDVKRIAFSYKAAGGVRTFDEAVAMIQLGVKE
jgi:deoxyribose-phosphate aldolase